MNYLELAQTLNELEKMNLEQITFFLSYCCEDTKLSRYVIKLLDRKMKLQQKEMRAELSKEKESIREKAVAFFDSYSQSK